MVRFWNFFLNNRSFTYFLVFLTLLAGIYAINNIPRESTPEITIPVAIVSTPFFGASAADVELLVTNKIEDAIDSISDISEYTSTSKSGFSTIVVEFEQNVDIDERVTRLKEAVDGAKGSLPSDGDEPVVTKVEFSEQPVLSFSLVSDTPFYLFQKIVDVLDAQISSIDGVAQFNTSGIPDREISVVIDNRKLLEQNIDFQTVLRSISGGNSTLPVGSITINSVEYPLDLRSEVATFDELRTMPIGNAGVSSLVITDVATLTNGYKEQDTITQVGFPGGRVSGAVNVDVVKKNGGDITKITAEVRDNLETLQETELAGIDSVITFDAGKDIQEDLSTLTNSGLQTVALVFLVLLFGVGVRESIIAAVSIPLSFMMAFIAFLVVGNTINFISLFALILSIGILVDTAIVVVEGINKKIQEGDTRAEAATATVKEFGIPLIAGTMTTVAVFFPLLFLSGIIGQFIRGIPYTVILVLLASLFVALGFVTVFCATFLKNKEHISHDSLFIRIFNWIEIRYEAFIHYFLQHSIPRRLFQGGIILAFMLSIGLVVGGIIKVEFFPGGDLEFAYIDVELAPGASIGDTQQYAKQVEDILLEKDYIESFVSTVGRTSIFNETVSVGDQYANITLNIDSQFQTAGVALLDPLRDELLDAGLADAELVAEGGGPPTGAPIDVSVSSEDTEALRAFVRSAEEILAEMEGPTNIASSLAGNNSGFDILIDRNALFRFGVDLSTIATTIRGATDGIELFDITENGEDVPVIVRNRLNFLETESTETKNITPDTLKQLSVVNNRGELILLGSLIDIVVSETDAEIDRVNGVREISLTADISGDLNANEVRAEFSEKLEEIVPEGVSYSFGGEAAEQDESFAEVGIAFLAGIFLMFMVLLLQFGRWRQTAIILSVVPFALTGVLLGLLVSGNALSFPAVLGLIALAGIVVNNSIILVSVFNQLRAENPSWDLEEVVARGSRLRLRPVLLTTITTIVGISPLLTASSLWSPIAYAIIFGLGFCILVTLVMIPLIYRRFEGFRESSWGSVGSFWMTVVVVLLLPVTIALVAFFVAQNLSGDALFASMIGIVLVGICMYVGTHVRRHR